MIKIFIAGPPASGKSKLAAGIAMGIVYDDPLRHVEIFDGKHYGDSLQAISVKIEVVNTQVFTESQVLQTLKNMGHDVTCGACMAVAFTGVVLPHDEHTCPRKFLQETRSST